MEQEQEGAREARVKEKEQRNKNMRNQEIAWEQTRREELGQGAIMGPTSSPVKRSQEECGVEGGAQSKRRKRRRKQEVLGADWGEREPAQEQQRVLGSSKLKDGAQYPSSTPLHNRG